MERSQIVEGWEPTLERRGSAFNEWNPTTYVSQVVTDVPDYEQLQLAVEAAIPERARRVLELGTGTGATTERVLARAPRSSVVGIDSSPAMLSRARLELPSQRVELLDQQIEDPLPPGSFDLIVSTLAIHHLEAEQKRLLFERCAATMRPGGSLVVGDLVVPEDPVDVVTPVDGVIDKPDTVAEHVHWFESAGLRAEVTWTHRDLAVIVGHWNG